MKIKKLFNCVFILTCIFFTTNIYALNEKQHVKVAFIDDGGFYSVEQNGGMTGYNYDYLKTIELHSNLIFDFIPIDGKDLDDAYLNALKMLETGEIDLVAPTTTNQLSLGDFEICQSNYGIVRGVLVSASNNYKITRDNYFFDESLLVALIEGNEKLNQDFLSLMQSRNYNYDLIYVKNEDEAMQFLQNEQVDAIVITDVSKYSKDTTYLTTINRNPIYFMAKNTQLIQQLDHAISEIEIVEPAMQERLIGEYFGEFGTSDIQFSKEESKALENYDYFNVAIYNNLMPYHFFDENTLEFSGISIEILNLISEMIGKEFRCVFVSSNEQLNQMFKNGDIDFCATLPYNYDVTSLFNINITRPYLSSGVLWLENINSINSSDVSDIYYYMVSDNIPFFPDDELFLAPDISQLIQDISNNGDSMLFVDPYIAQYNISKLGINNILSKTVSNVYSDISLGVANHIDSTTIGLINRAIVHLDDFVIDDIIYRNTKVTSLTVQEFLEKYSIHILTGTSLFFLVVSLLLYNYSIKMRDVSRLDSLTKLYNAGFFHKTAGEHTPKMQHGMLILVDIDFFKQVNDTYGHQKGDEVIIAVANHLKQISKGRDRMLARLGGDEFVALLSGEYDLSFIQEETKGILKDLAVNETGIPVSLSIGGIKFTCPTDYKKLYHLADENLYVVKENGRNGYHFTQI